MKVLISFLLLWSLVIGQLIAQTSTSVSQQELEAWADYKEKHNKKYGSPEEDFYRMKVFLDNKEFIESHNTKAQSSFQQGINPLSDLTAEEIVRTRCGLRADNLEPSDALDGLLETLLTALNNTVSQLPDIDEKGKEGKHKFDNILSRPSLDWRQTGRVSRVKDQGPCGACWSFAVTGALEAVTAAQNRSTLLSEQNLVDCSSKYGNNGCAGGLMDNAYRYIRDYGLMAARDYPYAGKAGSCKFEKSKSIVRVRGSVTLPPNEALLRLTLALVGPIAIGIDASPRSFHSYKSGVYDDTACKNKESSLNHAVLLVGYGTDKSLGDYWILKNSWGKKWGDNGYMKIARNRNNLCGVSTYAVIPVL